MSDHVPTTEEVEESFVYQQYDVNGRYTSAKEAGEAFDLWLDKYDREVKAQIVDEIITFLESQIGPPETVGYAHLAASTIRWWYDGTQPKEEA